MGNDKGPLIMLVKEALEFGKVSKGNTKMPGTSYAVDAFACNVGSKLAQIKGTPCHGCYARRLQKIRPSVDKGYKANLHKWRTSDPKLWVEAMVFQILRSGEEYHRWFDSGDLQSRAMLNQIIEVCKRTPNVKHWLPTQERTIVDGVALPANLVVRLSGSKVNGRAPNAPNTSTVFDKQGEAIGQECLAYTRGNNCGDCRACWNPKVKNISYKKH